MKVGVLLGEQPPELGGAYTIQRDIFESFLKLAHESSHEYVVFVNFDQVDYVEHIRSFGIEAVHYPAPTLFERFTMMLKREFPIARKRLRRATRLERIAREAGVEFMWFISEGPVMMDLPYLTVVWDLQHRNMPWFPEVSSNGVWDMREDSLAWFLRRAARIIVGGQVGQQEIVDFYQVPQDRFKVLPHPTPSYALEAPDLDWDQLLAKFDLPDEFLFYPAQFWPHKNHANLLRALQILQDQHDLSPSLVFTGSNRGNFQYIEALVEKLGLGQQVRMLGFVSTEELLALYKKAIALVYASFVGPENLPPLEAFALGCPVIATRVAGAEEQLGDAALLVDPAAPAQFADAVLDLFADQELRRTLIERGLKRARHFTGNDYARGVFEIFDEFEPIRFAWGRKLH